MRAAAGGGRSGLRRLLHHPVHQPLAGPRSHPGRRASEAARAARGGVPLRGPAAALRGIAPAEPGVGDLPAEVLRLPGLRVGALPRRSAPLDAGEPADVRLEELDFDIPEELIAQEPLEPRDSCRLMRLHGGRAARAPRLLGPARAPAAGRHPGLQRLPGAAGAGGGAAGPPAARWSCCSCGPSAIDGGRGGERWEALARPSHRLRPGEELALPGGADACVCASLVGEGRWVVEGPPGRSLLALMEEHGRLAAAALHQDAIPPSPPATRPSTRPRRARRPRRPPACTSPRSCWTRLRDAGVEVGVRDPARGPGHLPAHPRADRGGAPIHREAFSVSRGGPADHPGRAGGRAAAGGRGHDGHPGAGDAGRR